MRILNDTLVPGTLVGTDPELAGLGIDPKEPPEELVSGETPVNKAPEELALQESELLCPPEEDDTPDELIPGRAPVRKGGNDMIRNLCV